MTHKTQYTQPVHEHIEPWHQHSAAEGLPQAEHGAKPNMFLLFIAFVASVAFVGLTILATYMYFNNYTSHIRNQRVENTRLGDDYRNYRDDIEERLKTGFVWLNDEAARAGAVTLPLDKARERVLARYQK